MNRSVSRLAGGSALRNRQTNVDDSIFPVVGASGETLIARADFTQSVTGSIRAQWTCHLVVSKASSSTGALSLSLTSIHSRVIEIRRLHLRWPLLAIVDRMDGQLRDIFANSSGL